MADTKMLKVRCTGCPPALFAWTVNHTLVLGKELSSP